MESILCRDCGQRLAPDARGCTKCALNLEAERMIDRLVRRVLLAALMLAAIVLLVVIVKLNH